MRFVHLVALLVVAFCADASPVAATNWLSEAWKEMKVWMRFKDYVKSWMSQAQKDTELWLEKIVLGSSVGCYKEAFQHVDEKIGDEAKLSFEKNLRNPVLNESQLDNMTKMHEYCKLIRRIPEEFRKCKHQISNILSQFKDPLCEKEFPPSLALELKLVVAECQYDNTTSCYEKAETVRQTQAEWFFTADTCDYDMCIVECAKNMERKHNLTHFLEYFSYKHNTFVNISSQLMALSKDRQTGMEEKCRHII